MEKDPFHYQLARDNSADSIEKSLYESNMTRRHGSYASILAPLLVLYVLSGLAAYADHGKSQHIPRKFVGEKIKWYAVDKPHSAQGRRLRKDLVMVDLSNKSDPYASHPEVKRLRAMGLKDFAVFSTKEGGLKFLWYVDSRANGREYGVEIAGNYAEVSGWTTFNKDLGRHNTPDEEVAESVHEQLGETLYEIPEQPTSEPSPSPRPTPSPLPSTYPSTSYSITGIDKLMKGLIDKQSSGYLDGLVKDNPQYLNGCFIGDADFFAYVIENHKKIAELIVEIDGRSDRATRKLCVSGPRVYLEDSSKTAQKIEHDNFSLMATLSANLGCPVVYVMVNNQQLEQDGGMSQIDSAIQSAKSRY